jgi:stage II sporulation protein M
VWLNWLERSLWEREVPGSSPGTPTNKMFKEFYQLNRHRVNFVLGLFAIGIFIGAVASFVYPQGVIRILEMFQDRFGAEPELNAQFAFEIFKQNLRASLLSWLGGVILGIAPALTILTNGFILGYLPTYLLTHSPEPGKGAGVLILALLPHGIIELPAFLLSAILGMMLGLNWLSPAAKGKRWAVFRKNLLVTTKYFVFVVLALLVAAFVEVFVSGRIVDNF